MVIGLGPIISRAVKAAAKAGRALEGLVSQVDHSRACHLGPLLLGSARFYVVMSQSENPTTIKRAVLASTRPAMGPYRAIVLALSIHHPHPRYADTTYRFSDPRSRPTIPKPATHGSILGRLCSVRPFSLNFVSIAKNKRQIGNCDYRAEPATDPAWA